MFGSDLEKKNDIKGRVRYWVRDLEYPKGWLESFKNGEPVIIYVPVPDEDIPVPVAANEVEPPAQEQVQLHAILDAQEQVPQEQVEQEDAEDAKDDIDWKKSFHNLSGWISEFIKDNTDLLLKLHEFEANQSKVTKTSP